MRKREQCCLLTIDKSTILKTILQSCFTYIKSGEHTCRYLNHGNRYAFRNRSLLHPDVNYISDYLLSPYILKDITSTLFFVHDCLYCSAFFCSVFLASRSGRKYGCANHWNKILSPDASSTFTKSSSNSSPFRTRSVSGRKRSASSCKIA